MREEYKSRDLRSKDPHDYSILEKDISNLNWVQNLLKGG